VYQGASKDTLKLPPTLSALFLFGNLLPVPLLTHAIDMQDGKNKKMYTYAQKIKIQNAEDKRRPIVWPKKKTKTGDSLQTRYVLGLPLYNGFMFHRRARTYRYIDGAFGLTLGMEKDLRANKKLYQQGGIAIKLSVPVGLLFVAAVAVPEDNEMDVANAFQGYYGYGYRFGRALELGGAVALQVAAWGSGKTSYTETHLGLATSFYARFKIKEAWGLQAEYCPQLIHITSPHLKHTQHFSFGLVFKPKQKKLSQWGGKFTPPKQTRKVSSDGRFVL
jgi:hypothetical protein